MKSKLSIASLTLLIALIFALPAFSAMEKKEWLKEKQTILKAYSSVSPTVRADAMIRLSAVDHPDVGGKIRSRY